MFRKSVERITIDGYNYYVDHELYAYIMDLRHKLDDKTTELGGALRDKERLEAELKAIKPVIERGTLKPAISEYCYGCKFGYRRHVFWRFARMY